MFLLERGDPRTLVHSASDLVVAGECEFRLLRRLDEVLGRTPRRERAQDAMLARTAALGEAHERRVLAEHVARFGSADGAGSGGVVEVEPARRMSTDELLAAHSRTLAAMEAGADVVYQASFFDGRFHGRADFLVRTALDGVVHVNGDPEIGRLRYAVYDTKLARRAKVTALLQLAAYADQLEAARVDPTDHVHLVLGTRMTTTHRLADLVPVFRARRGRLLQILAEHGADDGPLAWGDDRYVACGRLSVCEDCAQAAEAHRDVLLVGGVYGRQRERLYAAGVRTIDDLAVAAEPPDGMVAGTFEGLRLQAGLQLGTVPGHGSVALEDSHDGGADGVDGADAGADGRLRWMLVGSSAIDGLPDPSPGDVFFDFEGDPLWEDPGGPPVGESRSAGLDYLFGLVVRPGAPPFRVPGPDDDPAEGFTAYWGDSLAGEREALVAFLDDLEARRRTYPGLHVYHYAPYEKTHLLSIAARHGVCEDRVDQLLRDGVLVDLYAVVRSSLRISHRSKSIKRLEPLYMQDDTAREGVKDAASSVIEYAEYARAVAEGRTQEAAQIRARILAYNQYDCRSTLKLLDWLRWARGVVDAAEVRPLAVAAPDRAALQAAPGRAAPPAGVSEAAPSEVAPSEAASVESPRLVARRETRERREALAAAIRERVPDAASRRTPDEQGLAILGAAVGYYQREEKPFWHEHYARLELPLEEWPGRRATFHVEQGRVVSGWEVGQGRRAPSRLVELTGRMLDGSRADGGELAVGSAVHVLYDPPLPPVVGEPEARAVRGLHGGGEIVEVRTPDGGDLDVVVLRERLGGGAPGHDQLPLAIAPQRGPARDAQEQAVEDAAARGLAVWDVEGALPAGPAVDLLLRRPPRLVGGGALPAPTEDPANAIHEAVTLLDRSYLAVQGPPGTGKTHVGSQVIGRLVAAGWRVGVVAQSHAAVENILRATVEKAGVPADAVAKKRQDRPGRAAAPWRELSADELAGAAVPGSVVGGTAWDFANPRWPEEGLDLLVVDEAGQFSLADTVAVARSARRLLLLGDPQQLPQVSQGRHPEPAVAGSALGWLADGHDVLPGELGYFLDRSWRMHPDLCARISRLAYEDRLEAHPVAAERSLDGVPPGVVHVPVAHTGRRQASPEEAEQVVREVSSVVGHLWVAGPGAVPRPLTAADVVVVAAYNAQVHEVRRALHDAGLGDVPVGTVDLFQGREAPVAILTTAASTPDDVPRGMGFLLSRHRVNVAVSRAQWRAVVISSPRLTDYLPGDMAADGVRQVLELGAFLALTSP